MIMVDKAKATVRADIKRNRLYISLFSAPNKDILAKVYTDVRFCVADLRPGFDVITDLSHCRIGHLNGISTLHKIMDYLISNQVGHVVRVVGKKSLLFKQIVRLATVFQSYSVGYVTSVEEAEDKLLNSARRNALRFRLHQQQIKYKINEEEEGLGQIVDISVSGCAVQGATMPLSPDMDIFLSFKFHREQDNPISFTLAARVVRAKEDMFAAQFLDLDEDQKKELYKCLAYEVQSENHQA